MFINMIYQFPGMTSNQLAAFITTYRFGYKSSVLKLSVIQLTVAMKPILVSFLLVAFVWSLTSAKPFHEDSTDGPTNDFQKR